MVRKNNRRAAAVLAAIVSIGATFAYGVTVGRYHVFPFSHLKAAKSFVLGPAGVKSVDAEFDGRRRNFLNRIAIHMAYASNADIVMIGDSITDYAEWSEIFPQVSIVNRGIAGDTTVGVLERMDSLTATGAKAAFILVGVNEVGTDDSVDDIFSNYEKIIEGLLAKDIKPYIQSTILVGEVRKVRNVEIVALNDRLRELARRQNLQFIDLNARLSINGVLAPQYTSDSIHLNAEGYKVWAAIIGPIINEFAIPTGPQIDAAIADAESRHQ